MLSIAGKIVITKVLRGTHRDAIRYAARRDRPQRIQRYGQQHLFSLELRADSAGGAYALAV